MQNSQEFLRFRKQATIFVAVIWVIVIYANCCHRNIENDSYFSAQYWKYMPSNLAKPYIHKCRIFQIGEINYEDGSGVEIKGWGFNCGDTDLFMPTNIGYRYIFEFDGTFGGYTLSELKEISEEVQYSQTGTAIDIGYSKASFQIETWYDTVKPKAYYGIAGISVDSSKIYYRKYVALKRTGIPDSTNKYFKLLNNYKNK